MTFKAHKIMKLNYLKREKNDQWLHNNFMVFVYYEFGFYELLNLPIRKKVKSKFSYFGKAWYTKSTCSISLYPNVLQEDNAKLHLPQKLHSK